MRRKLASRRGETLVETLAAILVVSLSSALFLTLITAGVRVSTAGDRKMQDLNEQMSFAEEADLTGGHAFTGSVKLIQAGPGQESREIPVTYYGDEDGLRAYRSAGGAP